MKRFLKIFAAACVIVPVALAAFFLSVFWPTLAFGYSHLVQGAWLLFYLVVVLSVSAYLEGVGK